MVFGMTRLGREATAYRMIDGHANHLANATQYLFSKQGEVLGSDATSPFPHCHPGT